MRKLLIIIGIIFTISTFSVYSDANPGQDWRKENAEWFKECKDDYKECIAEGYKEWKCNSMLRTCSDNRVYFNNCHRKCDDEDKQCHDKCE